MITADDVKRMRDETGKGLAECKAILERRQHIDRLRALLAQAQGHSERDPIAAILEGLIAELIESAEQANG